VVLAGLRVRDLRRDAAAVMISAYAALNLLVFVFIALRFAGVAYSWAAPAWLLLSTLLSRASCLP
jgi:hypothetical protein